MYINRKKMADSTSSESSPISGSYYSDFEASMEREHDERVYGFYIYIYIYIIVFKVQVVI